MRDERVDFLEAVLIEQQLNALARRQLAGIALALQPLFPTTERSPAL
jgi:hypothetical protein